MQGGSLILVNILGVGKGRCRQQDKGSEVPLLRFGRRINMTAGREVKATFRLSR